MYEIFFQEFNERKKIEGKERLDINMIHTFSNELMMGLMLASKA